MIDMVPSLALTTFYGGLLGVIWLGLTWGVIMIRRAEKISLGDGGNKLLERRMRGHANFTESVPLILVLLALIEYVGGSGLFVHLIGISIVVGRALHAYAFWLARPVIWARMTGMILTLIAMVCAAGGALLLGSGVF